MGIDVGSHDTRRPEGRGENEGLEVSEHHDEDQFGNKNNDKEKELTFIGIERGKRMPFSYPFKCRRANCLDLLQRHRRAP